MWGERGLLRRTDLQSVRVEEDGLQIRPTEEKRTDCKSVLRKRRGRIANPSYGREEDGLQIRPTEEKRTDCKSVLRKRRGRIANPSYGRSPQLGEIQLPSSRRRGIGLCD